MGSYDLAIGEYLRHKHTPEAQLFGHCRLFLAALLREDHATCRAEMAHILAVPLTDGIHPFPLGCRMTAQLLYGHRRPHSGTSRTYHRVRGRLSLFRERSLIPHRPPRRPAPVPSRRAPPPPQATDANRRPIQPIVLGLRMRSAAGQRTNGRRSGIAPPFMLLPSTTRCPCWLSWLPQPRGKAAAG